MIPRNDNERMNAWLERAWLQNYLERGLDDEESAWFEAYVLDKPELLKAIETDTDLRDGLAVVAAERSSVGAASAAPRRESSGMPQLFALAATLVVGIGVGLFVPRSAPDGGSQLTANPARIVYDTMRGEAVAPQFEPAAVAKASMFLVEVAVPSDAAAVQVRIGDRPPQSLRLASDGFVSFLVPAPLARSIGRARVEYERDGQRHQLDVSFPTQ